MIESIFDGSDEYKVRATKSLYWNDIPGLTKLIEDCPSLSEELINDKDMLDEFISKDDPHNPTSISAYVSRFRGILLVYYQDDDTDTIRFINVLPNTDENKKYVIYKLSRLGAPKGMTPEY